VITARQIDEVILDQINAALARNEATSPPAAPPLGLAPGPVQAAAVAAPVAVQASPVLVTPASAPAAPDWDALQSPADVLRFLQDRMQQSRPDVLIEHDAVRMTQQLGRGGFGAVYACDYHGTPHAVKRICIDQLMASGSLAPVIARMTLAEITAMLRLRHRRLVQLAALCFVAEGTLVYEPDTGTPQELDYHEIWMLMPLADGGSLRPAMGRLRGNPVLCMRLLSHVAEAVVFMHGQGSAHLDIKPDNVLLDDSMQSAVLADLGLVQQMRYTLGSALPSVARGCGTPGYGAPEQMTATGDVALKLTADVFAFGITALELLTGMPVTKINLASITGTIAAVLARLPPAVQSLGPLLVRCVSKDPAARPSMNDVYRELCAASSAPVAAAAAAAR
jgi:serine/threonine protein kinase